VIWQILPNFDDVVENKRQGDMSAQSLGADVMNERFPRLVYCGISGFGADGPYRDRPGFDQIAQGMSGFMSLTGTEASGPTRAGIAIGDLLAGIFAAHGIQLALLERATSGRGQVVETSLLEALVSVLSWGAGMYFESGKAPGPAGQHHPLASPYGRFSARNGYLNIAAGNVAMWEKLAATLGRETWLTDARFSDLRARIRNREELTREIDAVLAGEDVDHWVGLLNRAGVPAGPVLDIAQVFADPQVLARRMLIELEHPEIGRYKTTGLPVKLSRSAGGIERPPPVHGEHTEEVLRESGFTASEIDELRRSSVI
jgi:formyl-CoA transferase/CoA:oxalate CoA-transferase